MSLKGLTNDITVGLKIDAASLILKNEPLNIATQRGEIKSAGFFGVMKNLFIAA